MVESYPYNTSTRSARLVVIFLDRLYYGTKFVLLHNLRSAAPSGPKRDEFGPELAVFQGRI